jgi:hypothetical protein
MFMKMTDVVIYGATGKSNLKNHDSQIILNNLLRKRITVYSRI